MEYICPHRAPSGENINERKGNLVVLYGNFFIIWSWENIDCNLALFR